MVKRISLAAFLVVAMFSFSGCRMGAPLLESMGGSGCTKTQAILNQWGRDARKNERFVDKYAFNYDINDPYRGDRLVGY